MRNRKTKTFRVKLMLDGDNRSRIYRTDGKPTHCCSFQVDYFVWERNTKHNNYQGWSGYVNETAIKKSLDQYNPDNLTIGEFVPREKQT